MIKFMLDSIIVVLFITVVLPHLFRVYVLVDQGHALG